MFLTVAQRQSLKANIVADPTLGALEHTPDNAFAVADAYNLEAVPAFVVWRSTVAISEIMLNGFDWAMVDNLSVGKARVWEWLKELGTINPSKPNIRAGIDACWVGSAAMLAVRAAVYVHCKRNARRIEKLFATGTGTDASPATAPDGFEGNPLTYQDVLYVWES